MSTVPSPSGLELEDEIRPYREHIRKIDRIIEGPARTLIRQAREAAEIPGLPRMPLWIAEDPVRNSWPNTLTTSLCLVTLNRLYRMRRRFPALKKEFADFDETLDQLRARFVPTRNETDDYFAACGYFADSRTFGFLNPFTSAQVFRLLMESGEDHAHTGVGCLTFFAMVWPLYRRSRRDPLDVGARIEPYRANAYVTAKCLLPLFELRRICEKRATLFRSFRKNLETLEKLRHDATSSSLNHWKFCAEIDSLRRHLQEMAKISIAPKAFDACDRNLQDPLERLQAREEVGYLFDRVVREMGTALAQVAARSSGLLGDAGYILDVLGRDVVTALQVGEVPKVSYVRRGSDGEPEKGQRLFRFDLPYTEQPKRYRRYLMELGRAAQRAWNLCRRILDQLQIASELEVVILPDQPDDAARTAAFDRVCAGLKRMADVNAEVAKLVSRPVDLHTRWTHLVMHRHVALAAARNYTDFDASELVSALAVVVRSKELVTEPRVADALEKAVVAREPDGSWRPGHPYFSADGLQALRAPAADMVWTLVSALARHSRIRVADEALFSFVDWLERTQREIPRAAKDGVRPVPDFGWSADQMREQDRIELFTSAYSVNALLAVRDLAEHRLWELCERRFTIVDDPKPLNEMAPVDLAVPHRHRLHSTLSRMMRENRAASDHAVYSLVLHGPPGSSKTTVAGALSHAMGGDGQWGRGRRLVRVTPADFTRLGEDRVDAQAHAIFELLRHVRGVTILFDEIDDLLRRREFTPNNNPRFLDLVIPAMLNRLQDLHDACKRQELCFLFGTNYVERIEPALMRRGRIDRILPVPYPDLESRWAIAEDEMTSWLNHICEGDPGKAREWRASARGACRMIAEATSGWSWHGVRSISEAVRARVTELIDAHATDHPGPGEVVKDWGKLVENEVASNPADIQTDSIYPSRLCHGTDSRELLSETLRHYFTYCKRQRGPALRDEMEGQLSDVVNAVKDLVKNRDNKIDADALHDGLREANKQLLLQLELLTRDF
jgi:hypothetical protein